MRWPETAANPLCRVLVRLRGPAGPVIASAAERPNVSDVAVADSLVRFMAALRIFVADRCRSRWLPL